MSDRDDKDHKDHKADSDAPKPAQVLGRFTQFPISFPLCVVAVTRLAFVLLSYLSIGAHHPSPALRAFPNNLFLDGFARWDSDWYAALIDKGYVAPAAIVADVQRNTAFFPLYPLLSRAVRAVVGDTWLAGLLVSNLAFAVAAVLLYRLVLVRNGKECAQRAVVLLCVAPFTVFFMAVYTESLFIALALAAFFAAERNRWLWAGVLAGLAGATRVNGILLVAALAILYLEQRNFRLSQIRWNFLFLTIGIVGPGAYLLFLWWQYGSPFEFWHAQYVHGWGREVPLSAAFQEIGSSLVPSQLAAGRGTSLTFVQIFNPLLFALVTAWAVWKRKIPVAYAVWALLMTASAFSKWTSAGRYAAVIFPAYIAMAASGERTFAYYLFIAISCALAAHHQILFALGKWVA